MFTKTFPLRFGDCDPSGIAYYPSYLRILDGAIEDFSHRWVPRATG